MSEISLTERLSPVIQQGRVVAFFAFDIGYEVALEKVGAILASNPVQPLTRKKQTPNYLQYTYRPQVLPLGEIEAFDGLRGDILATIFDFGAVSISYHWSLAENGQKFALWPARCSKPGRLGLIRFHFPAQRPEKPVLTNHWATSGRGRLRHRWAKPNMAGDEKAP